MRQELSSPFSQAQQTAILSAGIAGVVLAVWYVLRGLRSAKRPTEWAPFGLSILLLSLAFVCVVAVYVVSWARDHPELFIAVPMVGSVAAWLAFAHDQKVKTPIAVKPTPPEQTPRPIWERHFFAALGIPCFAVFIMLIGGCNCVDIALHEARTTATVTGAKRTPPARATILYTYELDGQTYTGAGDPGNPPYPPGSTFEIRYSTARPWLSVAHSPLTIFGQFLVGSIVLLWVDYMAGRRRR